MKSSITEGAQPQSSKKTHVLLVTTSFPLKPNDVSGIFVKRLADALSSDHKVFVLTPCSRQPSISPDVCCFRYAPRSWQRLAHEPGGIPVALKQQPLLWLLVPIFLLSMLFATLRAGRSVDVIHANWAITGLICGLAGKLLRKPVITTLRGADVSKLEQSKLNRIVLRLVLLLNSRIITVSTPMQKALQCLFPHQAKRIMHIPNGVDQRLLSMPLTSADGNTIRLVSIGSLIPRKANSAIVQALHKLPATVSLSIIGEGPEQTLLTDQVLSRNLSKRVHFRGAIPPNNIPDALAQHDVLILASHSEGRPNVVVEAMAAGRTILASRLPGIEELIKHGHNGLLFEPGNPSAIAQTIRQLLDHPEKVRELGQAARQTILDLGLSWPECARQYQHIYHQVLQGDA